MPEQRIIYIAGFNVRKNTGRNNATRQKAAALARLVDGGRFAFYCPAYSRFRLMAYVTVLIFDFLMLGRLFFVDKNARILQRTTFLPLTNIYLRLRRVTLIYELHTDMRWEIAHYQRSFLEKLVLRCYVAFEELNLRLATGIIYNHPTLQAIVSKRHPKPSIYSYNGANTGAYYPMERNRCRKELGLLEGETYFLFSGSLAKWRGIENLIRIFIQEMSEQEVLLIIGHRDHNYGKQLSEMSVGAGNIRFVDHVPEKTLATYINAADLCLVPVNPLLASPGNPLKLYDYMACGKPVAGQESMPGCSDEIERWNAGMVTDFNDIARAAGEMRQFLAAHDPNIFRNRNRQTALTAVSWDERMKSWMTFAARLTTTG